MDRGIRLARVEHEEQRVVALGIIRRSGGHAQLGAQDACLGIVPVGLRHGRAVGPPPEQILQPVDGAFARMQEPLLAQDRMGAAKGDHMAGEFQEIRIRGRPVDPAGPVVLAIGIVVAPLRIPDLVARKDHRRPLAQQQRRHHVAPPQRAGGADRGIRRRALHAEIVGPVRAVPVAVVLAIGLVVPLHEGYHVRQREPVMGRQHVDRRRGRTPRMVELQRRARQPVGHDRHVTRIAPPEPAHTVAKTCRSIP